LFTQSLRVPCSHGQSAVDAARYYTLAQFEALDLLSGHLRLELGGDPKYIDIVGVNYYLHNQWTDGGLPIGVDSPQYRPFRGLLTDFYERYHRPVFVAETGIEGDSRPAWLRMVGHEVAAARLAGIPVGGICVYPIVDYPGWEDERHCPTGLFGYLNSTRRRPLDAPLARELALQRAVPVKLRPIASRDG
jgi:hypothetical protein